MGWVSSHNQLIEQLPAQTWVGGLSPNRSIKLFLTVFARQCAKSTTIYSCYSHLITIISQKTSSPKTRNVFRKEKRRRIKKRRKITRLRTCT